MQKQKLLKHLNTFVPKYELCTGPILACSVLMIGQILCDNPENAQKNGKAF